MTSTVASPANPAALGLAAFGLTTVLLSTINAGFLPAGGEAVVIPLALAFGGTAQMVAGLMEYRLQNVFGATAFLSYGAFWWWFGLLVLLGHNNVLDLTQAGSTIGFGLILWGIFTFGLWIASFRLSRAVCCTASPSCRAPPTTQSPKNSPARSSTSCAATAAKGRSCRATATTAPSMRRRCS